MRCCVLERRALPPPPLRACGGGCLPTSPPSCPHARPAEAAVTGALVALYLLLLLYMTCWTKLEAFFSATPWLRHSTSQQAGGGSRKYAMRCPFTGALHCGTAWLLPPPRHTTACRMQGKRAPGACRPAGSPPTMRCPSCGACVHGSAFHRADRLVA